MGLTITCHGMGWEEADPDYQLNESRATRASRIRSVECERTTAGARVCCPPAPFSPTLLLGLLAGCMLIALGCEQTFQPFQENDEYPFSMYGYLDASADTQWVRITPARKQLAMPPVIPADMQVTLEDLKTGTSTQLNDSLFLQANGFHYLNYWTTMDVKPEYTYRVAATDSTGNESRVTVTIPKDFATPDVEYGGADQCYALMNTRHVHNLAALHTRWHIRAVSAGGLERTYRIPYRDEIRESGVFAHMAEIEVLTDWEYLQSIFSHIEIYDMEIFIASGGPEWLKEIAMINDIEYALPDGKSNVENGLGYVIGIVSKTIPYEGKCPVIMLNGVEE